MTVLLALMLAAPAPAAAPVAPVCATAPRGGATQASAPLSRDDRGRPQICVTINAAGPFPMVVDTAAQTSLLSPTLAETLHLPAMASGMAIAGATGSTQAQAYPVDRFASPVFSARDVAVLRLPNPGSTSARGIVGMEYFSTGKLLFDHAAARLSTAPSAAPAMGFVAHKGSLRGGLLVVPVLLDGVTVPATIDTGAAVTIANHAALKALGWRDDDPRLAVAGAVRGATVETRPVRRAQIGRIKLGPVGLSNVPLLFDLTAPVAGGSAGGGSGENAPMLILGSDLLNLLDAYALDFPRAELQIRIPRPAAPAASAPRSSG